MNQMTEADQRVLALLETARLAMLDASDAVRAHFDGTIEVCVGNGLGWHLEMDSQDIERVICELRREVCATIYTRITVTEQSRQRGLRVEN